MLEQLMIRKTESRRPSSSGEKEIYWVKYEPAETRGVIEIAHGMCEHSGRYEAFARYLAGLGFSVYLNDHLGHGQSAGDEPGVFTHRKGHGFDYVIEDMRTLLDLAKTEHPGVPAFLLGHSMGSILSGLFADLHGDMLDGLVLMGTPAPNPAAGPGLALAGIIRAFKGGEAVSKLLCDLSSANMHVPEEAELGRSAWISYNTDNIRAYDADPLCGFPFTVGAMQALVKGMGEFGGKNWGRNVPRDLPVLVIAGADDPCGDFGKGPDHYAKQLQKQGVRDVRLKLILGARHEILNEKNREDTFAILGDWFTGLLPDREG